MSADGKKLFNEMEIDSIGEILNISLGSSATAVSDMLERRVNITTPKVKVAEVDEFAFTELEPAIGVEITYVAGLEGNNVMVLKRLDVKNILELLMHTEIPDDEFELDELSISAVCEVMNQMMGASATALAEFLGETVNISTPISFEIENEEEFKQKYFKPGEPMVVGSFKLEIEGCLSSEFMTLMEVKLAKKLVSSFGISEADENGEFNFVYPASESGAPAPAPSGSDGGGTMSQAEIEAMMAGMNAAPAPTPAPAASSSGGTMSQAEIEAMMAGMNAAPTPTPPPAPAPAPGAQGATTLGSTMSQADIEAMMAQLSGGAAQNQPPDGQYASQVQYTPQPQYAQPPQYVQQMQQAQYAQPPQYAQEPMAQAQPRLINTQPISQENPAGNLVNLSPEGHSNLDLIMQVPLQVSVEIGRTKKSVKEILDFTRGTLVVLDKMAGDQIDIYVNGQQVARGDVVVIDDSFGVRITEILKGHEMLFKNKE